MYLLEPPLVDTASNMVLLEEINVIEDRTANKWVTGATTDYAFGS